MLTFEQKNIVNKCKQALNNNTIVVLEGSAGVGKTTVVPYIVNRGLMTAPTNKAVSVLSSKTDLECRTLHSHLGLKLIYDYKGGYAISKDRRNRGSGYRNSIIVVDEASMVCSTLLEAIEKDINKNNNRYLLVGDNKQLNPVKEKDSPIFNKNFPVFSLQQIIRQAAENDNIFLSRNLSLVKAKTNGTHYKWVSKDEAIDLVADGAKFISWTNRAVNKVNTEVRATLFDNPNDYEVGETLLFKAPYISYKNNDEIKIDSMESFTFKKNWRGKSFSIECWLINLDILVVKSNSIKTYNTLKDLVLNYAKFSNNWKLYYDFIETFADVQHNYAITCHKSQGSTYDNCVVYISEMLKNPNKVESKRMVYTAITRTANKNYFI